MATQKTICITAGGERLIPRYYLRSGLVEKLARAGFRVVLLTSEREKKEYEKEFAPLGVEAVGFGPIRYPRLYSLLITVSRSAFHARLNKWGHWGELYLVAGLRFWKICIYRAVAYAFGTVPGISRLVQAIVRSLVMRISFSSEIGKALDAYHPDLLFATSATFTSFDVPVMSEAHKRGITVIAGLRGWDALSNMNFLLFHPDHLLVQSAYVKEMAVKYHFMPPNRVAIIGFPYFDWYRKKELVVPREEFLKGFGIDSAKRMILFAAAGGIWADREADLALIFNDLVEQKKIPQDVVLVFRHHPLRTQGLEKLEGLRFVILDTVQPRELPGPGDPEGDRVDFIHKFSSLYHSEMVVTTLGTIVLDAVSLDKPVVALAFDGKTAYPYKKSLRRMFRGACLDWSEVAKCGGMRLAFSSEEFARAVNEYLGDSSRDSGGRACIRERFVAPCDGTSSDRLAAEILKHT